MSAMETVLFFRCLEENRPYFLLRKGTTGPFLLQAPIGDGGHKLIPCNRFSKGAVEKLFGHLLGTVPKEKELVPSTHSLF